MTKTTKARNYNSPKLQGLLDEITPLEMEQTKIKMQLAARIEDLMEGKGWSKSQFAEKLRKDPSEITKWLSGTHNFTVDGLIEIASTLGVESTALFPKSHHSTNPPTPFSPSFRRNLYQKRKRPRSEAGVDSLT